MFELICYDKVGDKFLSIREVLDPTRGVFKFDTMLGAYIRITMEQMRKDLEEKVGEYEKNV